MSQEPSIRDKLHVQHGQFELPNKIRIKWTGKVTGKVGNSDWSDLTKLKELQSWVEHYNINYPDLTHEIEYSK
jgi:hypothetical protein